MRTIKVDGELCRLIAWQKPEDSDAEVGECVYAIYPAITGRNLPVLAFSCGNGMFRPLYFETDYQPLYVLEIPAIGKMAYCPIPKCDNCLNVGDLRENKPKILEFVSHEAD